MAHMRLRPRPPPHPHGPEARCHFVIVGNSSKLEQDPGDFDDQFPFAARAPGSRRFGMSAAEAKQEEKARDVVLAASRSPKPGAQRGRPGAVTGFAKAKATPGFNPHGTGTSSANKRYASEWVCDSSLGFATVDASLARLVLTYYAVGDRRTGAVPKYAPVYKVNLERPAAPATAAPAAGTDAASASGSAAVADASGEAAAGAAAETKADAAAGDGAGGASEAVCVWNPSVPTGWHSAILQ